MKKIIFIILISFFLFGCHHVEQVDYSKIPMLYNNYKNGYYEYTDELPHMDVLAYACEVGDFLPMSNYMNCYQLKDEYRNNDKIDTQDAQDIATYQFNVVVSGTQMEPQT